MHYVPSNDQHELRIEQKWRLCRNKDLYEKKSEEEQK